MSNNTISQLKINNEIYDLFDARTYADIEQFKTNMTNMLFPIGYIYMSTDSTRPSQLFGGTWAQIQNTFLLAAGTSYAAGTTGGEATHALTANETAIKNHSHSLNSHTHSTTIGAHTHSVGTTAKDASNILYVGSTQLKWYNNWLTAGSAASTMRGYISGKTAENLTFKIPALSGTANSTDLGTKTSGGPSNNSTGGLTESNGAAHNNMPPYLAVYMWKKIAN